MKNIYKAIAEFQQEIPVIYKDSTGYGYNYADLPTIFEAINPLMKKHGLGFTQPINGTKLLTIVFHVESGETLESATDIPQGVQLKGMNDFQVFGSGITYLRRYALSSLLGLVTDKDEDMAGKQKKEKPVTFDAAPKLTPDEAMLKATQAVDEAESIDALNQVRENIRKSKILTDESKGELAAKIMGKLDLLDPTE